MDYRKQFCVARVRERTNVSIRHTPRVLATDPGWAA